MLRRLRHISRNVAHLRRSLPTHYAAAFGGTNQYLSAASSDSLAPSESSYTFAGWVYFDNLDATMGVIGKYHVPDDTLGLVIQSGGGLQFYAGDDTYHLAASAVALVPETWHFFAAWYDVGDNTIRISVDDESPASAASAAPVLGSTDLGLGLNTDSGGNFLAGRLDGLGFWSRALSAEERTWLYNEGQGRRYSVLGDLDGLTAGLVSFYDFDEAEGSRADRLGLNPLTDHNGVSRAEGVS